MNTIRSIRFAFHNSARNIWLSAATILILMLTLFSITLLGALNLIGNKAIETIKKKVDVTVFFQPETSLEDIQKFQDDLQQMDEVASMTYVSREEALEQFREEHREDPLIQDTLDILDENPLGANVVVRARSIDDFDTILSVIQSPEYEKIISKPDFEDHRTLISRLESVSSKVQQVGIIVSSLFVFVAILVIFNTIRIAIYSQREEIGIQRLVGATNTFIRAPYLIEGGLYAILSSVLTMAVLFPIVRVVSPRVSQFFEGYNLELYPYFLDHFWAIFFLLIIIGLFLSIISSIIAINRYLRV